MKQSILTQGQPRVTSTMPFIFWFPRMGEPRMPFIFWFPRMGEPRMSFMFWLPHSPDRRAGEEGEGEGKKGAGRAGRAVGGAAPAKRCTMFTIRRGATRSNECGNFIPILSSPSYPRLLMHACFFFLTSRMHRSDGSINFKEFPTSQTSTTSEKSETSQTSKTLQTSKNSNVPRKVCRGARRNGVQYFNLGQLQLAQPELFSPNQNSKGYPSINLIRKRASEEESFSIRRFLDRVPLLAVKL